eukprot:3929218-Prymnesium_polylepis.3
MSNFQAIGMHWRVVKPFRTTLTSKPCCTTTSASGRRPRPQSELTPGSWQLCTLSEPTNAKI